MINENRTTDFYDIAYVTLKARKQIEELMSTLSINMTVHDFLNERWFNALKENDGCGLRFKLAEDGFKSYYAFCEPNTNENRKDSQIWQLTNVGPIGEGFLTLRKYAWLGNESKFLDDIANMALPENWTDAELPGTVEKNNVLKNYLETTFSFLAEQKNGITQSSDGRYSAFNTGLVDNMYDYIYVVFQKHDRPEYPSNWKYVCCTTLRRKDGKHYLDQFSVLPERARFSEVSELFLIPGKVVSDFEHIFQDNFDRIPLDFIRKELSSVDEFAEFLKSHDDDKDEVRDFILEHQECLRRISVAFDNAVTLATKRWGWNYKTAVPIYYPTKKKIQFLLPLYFSRNMDLDAALVIDKTEREGEYRGVTILTSAMAYLDARLLCRPDSDWLLLKSGVVTGDSEEKVGDKKTSKQKYCGNSKSEISVKTSAPVPEEPEGGESGEKKCVKVNIIKKTVSTSAEVKDEKLEDDKRIKANVVRESVSFRNLYEERNKVKNQTDTPHVVTRETKVIPKVVMKTSVPLQNKDEEHNEVKNQTDKPVEDSQTKVIEDNGLRKVVVKLKTLIKEPAKPRGKKN